MKSKSESKEKLVNNTKSSDDIDIESGGQLDFNIISANEEYILNEIEKKFILTAERGDCPGVKRLIDENKDNKDFNINCVDPLNRSALISAIENENFELIQLLLEEGILVGDALLHAISEEYVEAVEELLQWEETNHVDGTPYSWEAVDRSKSNFTPDITPLILAAHRNNYEVLKLLLDRGATLPIPHDVKCGCDICVKSQETDSLRHSQSRINSYRALSASSLIALSSRDPVLTSFQLSYELKHLQAVESEFRAEYSEMRQKVQEFVSSLLDHARTSTELEVMLNFNHEATTIDVWMPGQRQTLDRLKLAIKYKQKSFVAHPNVQQLLAAIWYDGLPGFRRKTAAQQLIQVAKLGCSFPIYSMNYLLQPQSEMALFMRKPFVQFIMHSTSYMFFLMLLAGSSLRIIPMTFELLAFPWMLEILEDWKKHERGSLPGPIELGIMLYIFSLIFGELKTLYNDGLMDYISDLWNIVDFISNMFYVTWILMRATAWIIAHRDLWYRNINPYFPREHWHMFDPMLLSEGAFAAAMIFSFLKLIHIFSINPHLGPLQVSLGRMIIDIIKFFFIYTLVLFAFGCGLNQLLWYYAEMEKKKCYHLHPDVPDFDDQEKPCTIWRRFANLFETSQSLFWASFGLVDLVSFDLAGIKGFTRFWALLMFGSYSVINIIVLLNMLIAMMSNSYQVIYEKSDVEWKFARSQLWMSYFEDGNTLPPPFNICPSIKLIQKTFGGAPKRTKSVIRRALEKAKGLHDRVMRLLVRRYVTAEQRKRDDYSITEDDIIEVRADISSFRYELLDILNQNNMVVPELEKKQLSAGTKKNKILERRIMKDFQIGFVETIATEMKKEGAKDIFSTIADIIGKKKGSFKDKSKDWNAIVRQNTVSSNPIGSKKSSLIRRSQRSLRRQMIEQANAGWEMDTDMLVEMNPKLSKVTPTTRVAYVKFMQKTLTKREQTDESNPEENSDNKEDTKSQSSVKKSALKQISLKKATEELAQKSDGPEAPEAPSTDEKSSSTTNKATVKPNISPQKPEVPTKPDQANNKTDVTKLTQIHKPQDDQQKSDNSKVPSSAITDGKGKAPEPPSKSSGKSETTTNSSVTTSSSTTTSAKSESDKKDKKDGTDTKPTEAGKTDQGKIDSNKKDDTTVDATKKADKTSDDSKKDDKTSDASKIDDKSTDASKKDDKTTDASKKDDKKPPPPRSNIGQSTSGAGATGDRGKSSVTGRMISGWL